MFRFSTSADQYNNSCKIKFGTNAGRPLNATYNKMSGHANRPDVESSEFTFTFKPSNKFESKFFPGLTDFSTSTNTSEYQREGSQKQKYFDTSEYMFGRGARMVEGRGVGNFDDYSTLTNRISGRTDDEDIRDISDLDRTHFMYVNYQNPALGRFPKPIDTRSDNKDYRS